MPSNWWNQEASTHWSREQRKLWRMRARHAKHVRKHEQIAERHGVALDVFLDRVYVGGQFSIKSRDDAPRDPESKTIQLHIPNAKGNLAIIQKFTKHFFQPLQHVCRWSLRSRDKSYERISLTVQMRNHGSPEPVLDMIEFFVSQLHVNAHTQMDGHVLHTVDPISQPMKRLLFRLMRTLDPAVAAEVDNTLEVDANIDNHGTMPNYENCPIVHGMAK